jgi:hypothetical protein
LAARSLGFDRAALRVHVLPHASNTDVAAAAGGAADAAAAVAAAAAAARRSGAGLPTPALTEGSTSAAEAQPLTGGPLTGGPCGDRLRYGDLPASLAPGEHTLAVATRSAVPWAALVATAAAAAGLTRAPLASPHGTAPPPSAQPLPSAALRAVVAAAHQAVLDQWFREQQPLLTPSREAALAAAWAAAAAAVAAAASSPRPSAATVGAGALPPSDVLPAPAAGPPGGSGHPGAPPPARLGLRAAYEAMFLADERAEYAFGDFLEDLEGTGRAERGEARGEPTSFSLFDAMEFLRANQ